MEIKLYLAPDVQIKDIPEIQEALDSIKHLIAGVKLQNAFLKMEVKQNGATKQKNNSE